MFGYPIVLMDVSRAKLTNVPHPIPARLAPENQLGNKASFPDASFTDVVSPNADTLYSSAWLDLKKEPIILSIPAEGKRYYLMPMLDAWTNVFASPGKRTIGDAGGDFAVTGPNWSGTLPAKMKQLKSPTNMVWLVGRTQTNGKADYPAVHAIQAKYKLTPLSAWGTPYKPSAEVSTDPTVDMKAAPVDVVSQMDASNFFNRLAALMKDNPPAPADEPMLAKLASIGILPGQPFDLNKNGSDVAQAISQGVNDGKTKVLELGKNPGIGKMVNGWIVISKGIGAYGTNYDARAGVAYFGLGANTPQDAMYPASRVDADGQIYSGSNRYVMHFDKGETPPVNGFWSLTMYNAKQAFVANPINRYTVSDRDKLKFNPDGSLDLYIQHDSPGKAKASNWLPADVGSFNISAANVLAERRGTGRGLGTARGEERQLDSFGGQSRAQPLVCHFF